MQRSGYGRGRAAAVAADRRFSAGRDGDRRRDLSPRGVARCSPWQAGPVVARQDRSRVPPIAAITIAIVLAAYKLIIVRLGELPSDDLPGAPALRDTGDRSCDRLRDHVLVAVGVAALSASIGSSARASTSRLVAGTDRSRDLARHSSEELLFRGILFRWLEEFGGSWARSPLTSALFGARAYRQSQCDLVLVLSRSRSRPACCSAAPTC